MQDNLARTISTVGIWLAYAVIVAFGVCRMNFQGPMGLLAFIAAILATSVAAGASTFYLWKSGVAR